MLKLKLQYFGYLVRRADTLETTLMLGRTEGRRRRERQRMRWLVGWHHQINGHEFEQTPEDSEEQRSLACYSPRGCKSQTQLRDRKKKKHNKVKIIINVNFNINNIAKIDSKPYLLQEEEKKKRERETQKR